MAAPEVVPTDATDREPDPKEPLKELIKPPTEAEHPSEAVPIEELIVSSLNHIEKPLVADVLRPTLEPPAAETAITTILPTMATETITFEPDGMQPFEAALPVFEHSEVNYPVMGELEHIIVDQMAEGSAEIAYEGVPLPENDLSQELTELATHELADILSAEQSPGIHDVLNEPTTELAPSIAVKPLSETVLAEQTAVLPQKIHESLMAYVETAEPEKVVAIEVFVQQIAQAASRLEELHEVGETESREAVAIETLLGEWYEELLIELGLPHDEVLVRRFIETLRTSPASERADQAESEYDDGMRESKLGFASLAKQLVQALKQKLQSMKLARFMVQATTA